MKTYGYTNQDQTHIRITDTVAGDVRVISNHPAGGHWKEFFDLVASGVEVAPAPAPPPEPDYDAELYEAISKATTIAGLKQALLGGLGSSKARVSAKAKGQA